MLILQGEKDENVPVMQDYLLRERLTELKKEFGIKLFPDGPHGNGPEVTTMNVEFFKRRLQFVSGLKTFPDIRFYLATTDDVATPPRLLRTVMFCGLLGHVKRPWYLPPPLLVSVPINWLFEVT